MNTVAEIEVAIELNSPGHAPASGPHAVRAAYDEKPSLMPQMLSPTQILDPLWGKYNEAGVVLYFEETHIVEL